MIVIIINENGDICGWPQRQLRWGVTFIKLLTYVIKNTQNVVLYQTFSAKGPDLSREIYTHVVLRYSMGSFRSLPITHVNTQRF